MVMVRLHALNPKMELSSWRRRKYLLVGTNTSVMYTMTTGGEMPVITKDSESPITYREVEQGCMALLLIFALYTEMIMRTIDELGGFKIVGKVVNNLRYADNTVIQAESEEQLQQLINVVVTESERKGTISEQCKVLHYGIQKCESEPYMQHHRPWKRSGAGPVLRLPVKYIHL